MFFLKYPIIKWEKIIAKTRDFVGENVWIQKKNLWLKYLIYCTEDFRSFGNFLVFKIWTKMFQIHTYPATKALHCAERVFQGLLLNWSHMCWSLYFPNLKRARPIKSPWATRIWTLIYKLTTQNTLPNNT